MADLKVGATQMSIADAAYQGSPGAYSEEAARILVGREAGLLPCVSLEHVFDAVAGGRARRAVVPVENSLAGSVPSAYELLVTHDLAAIGETTLRIDHTLIAAPGAALADVRRVLSHPVALAQCERFFREHREIEAVPVFDTAGAVEMVMRERRGDTAAIAARRAAEVHGAAVLAERIQDHEDNFTRFVLLAPAAERADWQGPGKCMMALRVKHEPGALWRALEPFARRGLSLEKIESRPIRGTMFEYLFYLDVLVGADRAAFEAALDELGRRATWLRVIGTYPISAAGDPAMRYR